MRLQRWLQQETEDRRAFIKMTTLLNIAGADIADGDHSFLRGGHRKHPMNNPVYFVVHHFRTGLRHVVMVTNATAANVVPL